MTNAIFQRTYTIHKNLFVIVTVRGARRSTTWGYAGGEPGELPEHRLRFEDKEGNEVCAPGCSAVEIDSFVERALADAGDAFEGAL